MSEVSSNEVTLHQSRSAREFAQGNAPERQVYERPLLLKKRSVSRVTLFSGTGASGASPLTAA